MAEMIQVNMSFISVRSIFKQKYSHGQWAWLYFCNNSIWSYCLCCEPWRYFRKDSSYSTDTSKYQTKYAHALDCQPFPCDRHLIFSFTTQVSNLPQKKRLRADLHKLETPTALQYAFHCIFPASFLSVIYHRESFPYKQDYPALP